MEKLLSELTYSDILLKANKEDINKIVFEENNLLNENDTFIYDIGIIFGGTSMIPFRVEKGLELYQKRKVKKLVVTGGIGFRSFNKKTKEAEKMARYLLDKGVPKEDIIIEKTSKNTIENIKNTLQILRTKYQDIRKLKYILITSDFHIRRCLGLFSHELSNCKVIGCKVKDGQTDKENWSNSFTGKKEVLLEAIILSRYSKQKRLQDFKIENLTLK